jgi:hypothetical protein
VVDDLGHAREETRLVLVPEHPAREGREHGATGGRVHGRLAHR